MFVLSVAAIIGLALLFSSTTHRETRQQDALANGPMPRTQKSFHRPYMSGPMYSPDKRYIWDAYRQAWVRHYTARDLVLNLVLGFVFAVGLLYYLGFIQ